MCFITFSKLTKYSIVHKDGSRKVIAEDRVSVFFFQWKRNLCKLLICGTSTSVIRHDAKIISLQLKTMDSMS
jgi:hypothetical protein